MLSDEAFAEMRQDFAYDWERTKGFTIPDPCPPLPNASIIANIPDSMRQIIEAVASIGKIPPREILGPRRHSWVVRYRTMAILAAHETMDKSTPQLGRAFNRDHTTIIHAIKRGRECLKDQTWRKEYEQLLRTIG